MIIRRLKNDELYHHGVKGQQWGVQNGPPYPLGYAQMVRGGYLKNRNPKIKKQIDKISNKEGDYVLKKRDKAFKNNNKQK